MTTRQTKRTTISVSEDLERDYDDLVRYVARIKGMSLSRFLITAAIMAMEAGIEDPANEDIGDVMLWGSNPANWNTEPDAPTNGRTTLEHDALAALDKLVL